MDNIARFPGAAPEPKCPEHLTGEARICWERTAAEMIRKGTFDSDCTDAITMYAIQWARFLEAERQVAITGPIVKAPKSGVPMHNPFLAVANGAFDRAAKLAAELGLTPAMRERVGKVRYRGSASSSPAAAYLTPR